MTIRWGLIGTGDVSERKSGPALYKAERSELVAVMNRTHARAVDFASRHGNPRVYESAEDLLADDLINAVYVGTAPDSHAELTINAAKAGKHVFCEKPMAMSVAECEQMVAACRENNVSLSIAFYRRFFPVVQKMKSLMDSGAIGKPLRISASTISPFAFDEEHWRLDPELSGGGFLMDMGTHRFDLFVYLFGAPKDIRGIVSAQTWKANADDAASVALEFADGVHGSAEFQWNCPVDRDKLQIVGTEGILWTDNLSGAGDLTLETKEGTEHWSLPATPPVHLNLVQKIVDHLLDGADNPCPGEDGVESTRIAEEIYQSNKNTA